jgi:hypothetical protein
MEVARQALRVERWRCHLVPDGQVNACWEVYSE